MCSRFSRARRDDKLPVTRAWQLYAELLYGWGRTPAGISESEWRSCWAFTAKSFGSLLLCADGTSATRTQRRKRLPSKGLVGKAVIQCMASAQYRNPEMGSV